MIPTPKSDTPDFDAWQQFRKLIVWSFAFGVAAAVAALWWISANGTPLRLHLSVALGGGILLAVLLAGGLMGLVFVSNRSGHDQEVHDQREMDDELP